MRVPSMLRPYFLTLGKLVDASSEQLKYARSKVLCWVDASLEEDCVDGVLELSC